VGNTPFHDLSDYMAIPRVGSIEVSPDGTWLAATVQTLSPDRKKYQSSIWRIDPEGGPARRLTRSAKGEGGPVFLPDGSLLFTSRRPDPDAEKEDRDGKAALWVLPADGGEARQLTALPGGIVAVETASQAGTIVVAASVMPAAGAKAGANAGAKTGANAGAEGAEAAATTDVKADDERLRKERKDAGVTAILHESAPIRYWDHDLGPAQDRLIAVDADNNTHTDLTPDPGRALDEQDFVLTPDGATVITGWWVFEPAGDSRADLVAIDTASGKRRTLLSAASTAFENPRVSADGRYVVCVKETFPAPDDPGDYTLVLVDLTVNGNGDSATDLLPDLDLRPGGPAWAPGAGVVYFTADDHGRCPVFQVDIATQAVAKLTEDAAAYGNLRPSPDGRYLYAMRTAIDSPPTPVKIDLTTKTVTRLRAPGSDLDLPGHLTEIEAIADDGHPIRSWLVLPESTEPAPLLLWVHGGPFNSWNAWAWRWNPWLMAAKGYAVLLPDPALSTGYGHAFLKRAYHDWGDRPFRDIMAATDAAERREDIDETRTAMMGGSYGGYMANWIAGHTDRFKAIVSHASLWMLEQMFGTTDMPMWWRPQFGDPLVSREMYDRNSPHLHVEKIVTPMLVIHGDKDYRVPIGEGLRLWYDLTSHGKEAKFLYFPDENHWVLTPGNATIWYETVFAFLAQHVLGEPWQRPELV
jgi:dipeptidyl aminopeptidase/acylaminoacyl peptidase